MTPFCLHHLLERSAHERPDAPAVRCAGEELSYGELESRANRVARSLAESGVVRGDRVAVHARKSVETLAAVYGVMKAGAAYVPIDSSSPAPRLAAIVEQCRPRAIVTWSQARERVPEELCRDAGVAAVVSLDDAAPFADLPVAALGPDDVAARDDSPLGVPVVSADLAYILFTSGSTGQPKGVMLSHLNALTFVDWVHDTFELRPDDRLSNHAPFTFDLSVLDLYGASRAGACVTLVPEGLGMFPSRLADLIAEEQLTVWYSVPSVLTLLLTRGGLAERDLSSLRWLLFAGEVFPTKYLRELMEALPGPRYANLYGPTETNVITWYEVPPLDEGRTADIPIGKACANSDCVVIAEDGSRVTAPGTEGLLHARGGTVMQGYFGRPEDTAKSFVRNPFAEGREELLYCTGDWVSLDENGDFLYLGRRDHMVKVGGYRVELGEIESALYAHPGVREAVAVALPDDLLGSRIRVVIVADGLSEQDVRQHCSTRLPRYMVPAEVEFRAALPRTATDKVDRPLLVAESVGAASTGGNA